MATLCLDADGKVKTEIPYHTHAIDPVEFTCDKVGTTLCTRKGPKAFTSKTASSSYVWQPHERGLIMVNWRKQYHTHATELRCEKADTPEAGGAGKGDDDVACALQAAAREGD